MRIALLGDVALFGRFSMVKNPGVFEYLKPVSDYLKPFQCVVGNLETPFVRSGRPRGAKSAYISSEPENVEILKFLGISAVNLANNHVFDYGEDGLECTYRTLEQAEIRHFGTDERHFDVGTVSFQGYCAYNTNPLGISRDGSRGINAYDLETVESGMLEAKRRGLLSVVSVHSGIEHVNYPSVEDMLAARQLAGVCPYVYYGHHPHVMQGVEVVGRSLIAYSLGNFCFDDVYTSKSKEPLIRQSDNNLTGLIVELEVVGGVLEGYSLTPIFLGRRGVVVGWDDGSQALEAYSRSLCDPVSQYRERRNLLIQEYIASRKKMRDLRWYVNRMNLASLRILWNARANSVRQKKSVSMKILAS
jgi:poly-gamma-glutamate synthesis protein (capsule biosynthesis protein)